MKAGLCFLLGLGSAVAVSNSLTSSLSTEEVLSTLAKGKTEDVQSYLQSLIDTLNNEAKEDERLASVRNSLSTKDTGDLGCNATSHNAAIDDLRNEIMTLHQGVEAQTGQMGSISDTDIPLLRSNVDAMHQPINDAEMNLDTLNNDRDNNKELYQEQRNEILDAISQIEAIRIEVQTSLTAERSQSSVVNFLESRAEVSRGLKSKLMRTAARALQSGAVDSIQEIFYKMRNEFKKQLTTLDEQEAASVQQWERDRQADRDSIGDKLIALEKEKQKISNQHTRMAEIEAQIAVDNINLARKRKALNNEQMTLEEKQRLCEIEEQNLVNRIAHRNTLIADLTQLKDELIPAFIAAEGKEALGLVDGSTSVDSSAMENTDEVLAAAGVFIVPTTVADIQTPATSPEGGAWRVAEAVTNTTGP